MPDNPHPSLQHIAFIMDGNGRWAKKRFLPRAAGHAKGAAQVRQLVKDCATRGIKYVTLYAFSTENWARPTDEVSALMGLFLKYLNGEVRDMRDNGIRLRVLGDRLAFSTEIQKAIADAEAATAHNDTLHLSVAANYGGRWDFVQATQSWQSANPGLGIDHLTEAQLAPFLSTAGAPEMDLLIRTGGESRVSNFMLWQAAYAELFFIDTLWPDFSAKQFSEALEWFSKRDRRFGSAAPF